MKKILILSLILLSGCSNKEDEIIEEPAYDVGSFKAEVTNRDVSGSRIEVNILDKYEGFYEFPTATLQNIAGYDLEIGDIIEVDYSIDNTDPGNSALSVSSFIVLEDE